MRNLKGQFVKGVAPWNKGERGRKSWHNTIGLIPGWNKGIKGSTATGNRHYHWGGDKVGYQGIHIWLNKTFGKATRCENCGLDKIPEGKKKYFDYALLKGKNYERKRENFWMLCISCHRKYDGVKPNKGQFQKGHKISLGHRLFLAEISRTRVRKPLSEEHKNKIRLAHLGKPSWNKGKKIDRNSLSQYGKLEKDKKLNLTH